ncbi:MAG: hypothetical protein LBJ92_00850 [Holosporales bacterium]|jgi:hypothetical protein|nr:hypothetical protein [Holosporales bacterium]
MKSIGGSIWISYNKPKDLIACLIVCTAIYLWSERISNKNLDELKANPNIGILNLTVIYIATLIGCIFVIINLISLVGNIIDFKTKAKIIRILAGTYISSLFLMNPFLQLQSIKNNAKNMILNAKVFKWIVVMTTVLTFVGFIYCVYSIAVPKIQQDIEFNHNIDEVAQILSQEDEVHEDLTKVLDKMQPYIKSLLQTGKIKYKKLNKNEFRLTWNFKSNKNEFDKIRPIIWTIGTKDIKFYDYDSYKMGQSEKVFKLAHLKGK